MRMKRVLTGLLFFVSILTAGGTFADELPPGTDVQKPADSPQSAMADIRPLTDEEKGQKIITMKFRNTEIETVVSFLAKLSNLIVVPDENIKGRITIQAPDKLTLNEAYTVLMSVLDVKGFSMIRTDRFLKLISKKDAVQKPVDISYGNSPDDVVDEDRVVTHITPLRYMDATEVMNNIRPLVSSTGNSFVNKEANAVIITDVGTNIRRLLKLVEKLDNPAVATSGKSGISTRVYKIKYMKSKDVADALTKVFSDAGSKEHGVPLKVTPVESVNDVVVTAESSMHKEIEKTIALLDARNRQVLIEAKIIEVTLSDTFKFGVNLTEMLFDIGSTSINITNGSPIAGAFTTATINSSDVAASIQALSTQGDTNILSAPRILTSDNQKSKISVGKEQPILKSVTDVSDSGDGKTVSDYVYKDVGLSMEVTPRINVDRDVTLDVAFTVTDILDEKDFGNVTAPVMGKRETSTSVTVKDGKTVVISGLIKNSQRDAETKMPLFGDIPLLGWLFKKVEKVNDKTELLIFLTPYVVMNDEESRLVAEQQAALAGHKIRSGRDSLNPAERKMLEADAIVEMIFDTFGIVSCKSGGE